MEEPVIPEDLFKNLFKISAIEEPSGQEYQTLYKDICEIISFIDSSLKEVDLSDEYLQQENKSFTKLRQKDVVETKPQIIELAPQVVSGLFCVPVIRNVEE